MLIRAPLYRCVMWLYHSEIISLATHVLSASKISHSAFSAMSGVIKSIQRIYIIFSWYIDDCGNAIRFYYFEELFENIQYESVGRSGSVFGLSFCWFLKKWFRMFEVSNFFENFHFIFIPQCSIPFKTTEKLTSQTRIQSSFHIFTWNIYCLAGAL